MNIGKKKGLGRGLSALFGDEKPVDKPQEINKSSERWFKFKWRSERRSKTIRGS